MDQIDRINAAKLFVSTWKDRGDEKQDTQSYWIDLLQSVFGMRHPSDYIKFEVKTAKKTRGKDFKDAVLFDNTTNIVLVEQKSDDIQLDKQIKQSDGQLLTPFEQAKNYNDLSPQKNKARWIITCNFKELWIYDMNKEGRALYEPVKLKLEDLPTHLDWLSMLESATPEKEPDFKEETEVSVKAGELVGLLYDALWKQYKKHDEASQQSLNKLCVRIVFCLYAEDSGLFKNPKQFHDYLAGYPADNIRQALIDLFKVLDTQIDDRQNYYFSEAQLVFPYVNGGLFNGDIEIPMFDEEIKKVLLEEVSAEFDWSKISPTIFGAVFESTLNQDTRRQGGMHYTSLENIHKVIDPLFLNDLQNELEKLKATASTTNNQLLAFQDKLASLTFLDPAAGSGNFLTETYLSLRKMENQILFMLNKGQQQFQSAINPIKVSIQQFYGIEINDFACSVAQTALWIAEHKMFRETEGLLNMQMDFLPLKTFTHIHEGNALRMNWNDVIPANKLSYIMGNPPFVGNSRLSETQKSDRNLVFHENCGELDYVCCWYKKAADYILNNKIFCAFVSTNSICQGQQVTPMWKPLFDSGIFINFAYKTFVWDSEAAVKAHVYCIIIGFSRFRNLKPVLFDSNETKVVEHINAYLLNLDDVFVERRSESLCKSPIVIKGFQPTDNGYLILSPEEKEALIKDEPNDLKWIRPFITAREYLYRKQRWCLWLVGATPSEIRSMPLVNRRIIECEKWRSIQIKSGDAYKLRNTPSLMRPNSKFREESFIVIPRVSGEKRDYIPFGYVQKGSIPGDSIMLALGAEIYHFGILCSKIHMAWTRAVCGRLKGDYRYSSDIVYNTFPWPIINQDSINKIKSTAQNILDARSLYPNESFDELYDPILMPIELRNAHKINDDAVMDAYGFDKNMSESEIVAELMKRYQMLVAKYGNNI